jgi:hypothetical protein
MKFLYRKLRFAVPLSEYEALSNEMQVMKQKQADWIDRSSKLMSKCSNLEVKMRKMHENEEKLRNHEEERAEEESEFLMIRKRLEACDPNFRWENAIFSKIVVTLKKFKVSPDQAFLVFDKNQDGRLSKNEFCEALERMKVNDLTNKEVDCLMGSIDVDEDGYVRYREFTRRLKRYGVKSRTTDE